jgi:hypothetical protein
VRLVPLALIGAAAAALAGPIDREVRGEVGLGGQADLLNFGNRLVAPTIRIWQAPLHASEVPFDQAAFLGHVGWAELAVNLEMGKGAAVDSTTQEMTGDSLGFDGTLRWVFDGVPLSLTIPASETSFRWLNTTTAEEDAKLRVHAVGIQPGWYVLDNLEVSAGFQYIQPDFWYRTGSTSWSWVSWDIFTWWVHAQSLWGLGSGRWISAEAHGQLFLDHRGNKLLGVSANVRFYPWPSFGAGLHASISRFAGDTSDAWSTSLRAMGVAELGLDAVYNLGSLLGVGLTFSYLAPEEVTVEGRLVARLDVRVRW